MNLQKFSFRAAVVCGVAAGIILIVASITTKAPLYAVWGVFFVIGTLIVAIVGGKGRPDGKFSPPTIGAKFTELPSGAWLAIAGMFVVALVLTFVLRG